MRRLIPLLFAFALPAFAQQQNQPLPAVPPPPPDIIPFDAALEPQVTITRNDKETREEYRSNGKLYMVKVTPVGGGAPYYLIDQKGDGQFIKTNMVGAVTQPPMWVIGTF
ncbi:MAG: hypothetical protein RIR00_958 [Pseudomonadota bacterium]|jgi:hypothetical protein